jgi:hypothetical protein
MLEVRQHTARYPLPSIGNRGMTEPRQASTVLLFSAGKRF